jgi:5-methyltetrahydrofolate corrinoid/iron sulfur protein methyltransferase
MFIIGERINGMYKTVKEAIINKDTDFMKKLAIDQVEAGADALDISVGPVKGDKKETMFWLVKTVSSAVSVPLCIDSPHPDIIEAGVKASPGKTIINSIKNSPEHVEKLIPLAVEMNCDIICLLMNDRGIPTDWPGKLEIAAELMTFAMEAGIEPDRLYFDPILLPVANAQKDVAETFELMDQLKMLTSPPPHMIVGLSNLSQKAQHRSLLERTYCTMAMSHGLDSAILDPLDEKLMHAVTAAETLLNRKLYAHSYLKT